MKHDHFKGRILKCEKCDREEKRKTDESGKGSKRDGEVTRIDKPGREY